MPKKGTKQNTYTKAENKKIFDEAERTGIRPTHLFCGGCNTKKPIDEFTKCKTHKNGVITICSECNRRKAAGRDKTKKNEKAREKNATPEHKEQVWLDKISRMTGVNKENETLKKHHYDTGTEPTHKYCNTCKQLLPLHDFSISSKDGGYFGRSCSCKCCDKRKNTKTPLGEPITPPKGTPQNIKIIKLNKKLKIEYEELGIAPTHKYCSDCEQKLTVDKFYISNKSTFGLSCRCQECDKANWRKKHWKDRDKNNERSKAYHNAHKDDEEFKKKQKEYARKSKVKTNERSKKRRDNDPAFKLKINLRNAFKRFLQGSLVKCMEYYKISYDEIMSELGPKPNDGKEYHVDHIIPCTAFDQYNYKHVQLCFHPTNLRWLERSENCSKASRIIPDLIRSHGLEWICEEIGLYLGKYKNNERFGTV